MTLISENARSFNSSLKKAVSEAIGQKVKVEIINSYNFPHCWVRVYAPDTFKNDFRLRVFNACGFSSENVDLTDIHYGNIGSNFISAYVKDWQKVFEKVN